MKNYTSVFCRGFLFFIIISVSTSVYAQIRIAGTVVDDNNQPLPGANIIEKGRSNGTSTDVDGKYTLTVEDNKAILVFSFIGFLTQEFQVDDQSIINVTLLPDIQSLNEIVVVGYGTQKKRDLTGSVSSVSAEQIGAVVASNAASAMQGRVPGLVVTNNSYTPGAGATVRIRGNRSITATNDPLYVIDGTPISRGSITLNDINPSNIESIEVLKDASATAIYGSRGANGVVLITTKRGKSGRTAINYDSYVGFQTPLNEPDVFNPAEYVEYIRESHRNSSSNTYLSPVPDMDEDKEIPQFAQAPYVLESVLMGYDENGNWHPDRVRGFDWLDAISRTGIIQNHSLSVSGGSEKTKVLVAAGYFGNRGMVENMDYKRYNLRTNIDFDAGENVRISGSMLVNRANENIGPNLYGAARSISPLGRPRDDDGNWIYYIGNDPLMTNPLLDIDGIVNESQKNRILSNVNVDIELSDGLSYIGRFGYDYRTARDGNFQSSDSRARLGDQPAASYGGNIGTDFLIENMLFYRTKFKDIHDLEITLLNSFQKNTFETYSTSVENLPYSTQQFYNVGSASDILNVSSGITEWQMLSWMGRVNYKLFDKYLFTLTGRSDGSSRLAPGNKYHFFPSASVAWRISDENFMQGTDIFNDLKLRLSYGKTGNSAIDPYQTQGSLTLRRYAWDEDLIIGYAPGSMPNPDLRWETTTQANIGLDFGLFNHRISGTIDAYRANTSDLLMPRALPVVSGFESVLANVGSTRNTGLEIALSTVNTDYESRFRWNTDFVFSTNKEEIVELADGKMDDLGNQWFIGQPISVYYNLEAIGIWQNTEEDLEEMAKFNANGHNFEPGLVKIKDQNGDYRITSDADRIILGSNRPKWTGSITNNLYYKNFDFSFQVYASYGAMGVYNQGLALNGRYNMTDVDYWTLDNPSNKYPKPNFDWAAPDNIDRTYNEDASFVRLQFVTLGYTLPTEIVNKFRVYVSAQNAYIYTNYTGPDPEGAQSVETPSPRTFMVGININF